MDFDPKFARTVLLPLAVHAYTVSGITRSCESLDTEHEYKILGNITVDPAKCMQVWRDLENHARTAENPAGTARAIDMLTKVMADSHTFGFVAVTNKDAFVCFRGTHFFTEWVDDADLPLVDYRFRPGTGLAHIGFQAVYETLRDSVVALVKKAADVPVTVLGHSLGAALATLCALDVDLAEAAGQRPTKVFPIASPRVGNGEFRDTFNNIAPDCIRIVNKPDLVPHLPLPILYRHVGIAAVINSGATLDLGFAHGLCEGYARGLNRTIADPALVVRSGDMGAEVLMTI